jgi:LysM repeat protein
MSVTLEGAAGGTDEPAVDAAQQDPATAPTPGGERRRSTPSATATPIVVCPHLESIGGAWRMAVPSRDHRCVALAPPAPQTVEKQHRHCLSADHVECPVFRAAASAREAALAGAADPATVAAADRARRPQPRTAPVLLELPRLVDHLIRLQSDRAPGQLLLIGLMVVAFAIVGLSRLAATAAEAVPSIAPPTSIPVASVVPGAGSPTVTPSSSAAASARPPASTAPPSTSPGFRTTYTVKRGDTLIGVASKFKTTAAKLRSLNALKSSTLRIGQVLKIP